MSGATVRIGERARKTLRVISNETGESMQAVLDKAIEQYRRQRLLQEANKAFAALRGNAKAWKAEVEERKAWDVTLTDDLEGD